MGCDGRIRARQPEAGRCARSLQHWQGGLGGQRLPLGADRGRPESEGLAEPYPPARRTKSSAVGAPEVGEHDALEGTRACRARIRPPAELNGRQDRAHHRHRAGEVQDRDDEPRLQHPPAGSARAAGGCAGLSALTGGVRAASCNGARGRPPGIKTAPDRGLTWARALHSFAQLRQNRQNQLLFEVPMNLCSRGNNSAIPIGVNAPMISPQAAAAANQTAYFELPSNAQKAAIPLIRTRAFVGAAISQNTLET